MNNVIYSKSLSENLLSLRRFAEAGWNRYLDNERIDIYDPETNETFVSGIYDSPYWIIEFEIDKGQELNDIQRFYDHSPTANLAINAEKRSVKEQTSEIRKMCEAKAEV